MNLASILTRASLGVDAPQVTVEVHIANGLPGFSIVGLPETVVRESRDRVRGAIDNSRFEFPHRRIIVNLAPADLPKEGGRFDLAIAIGILVASEQIQGKHLGSLEFLGELALTGALRTIPGALPATLQCKQGQRRVLLPQENHALLPATVAAAAYPVGHLLDAAALLEKETLPQPVTPAGNKVISLPLRKGSMDDVIGHALPKRALQIAAAGGHNVLMVGPPGTGKSMLAARLTNLLPPLQEEELLEVESIYSVIQQPRQCPTQRPFREPHHSASAAAIVGGGPQPLPGEISLAHHGVLFLDEMPEFSRPVLETLREPMERGEIMIARARYRVRYPARFQLIGAMNPCPVGRSCTPLNCECGPNQAERYHNRISTPLRDRIDIHLAMNAPIERSDDFPREHLRTEAQLQSSACKARGIALERQQVCNADLPVKALLAPGFPVTQGARALLVAAVSKLELSLRSEHRTLRVARTIADLEEDPEISERHLAEALSLREQPPHWRFSR